MLAKPLVLITSQCKEVKQLYHFSLYSDGGQLRLSTTGKSIYALTCEVQCLKDSCAFELVQ